MAVKAKSTDPWYDYLHGIDPQAKWMRRIFSAIPRAPRCKLCRAPFGGLGGWIFRLGGFAPSRKNPRFCNSCEVFVQKHHGGTELELSFLFADVRGSTALAERMTPSDFSRLLNRFYSTANTILVENDALIDNLVGDEVIAVFAPLVGNHPRRAVETAGKLLVATGHGDASGPWIRLGIGVHTGTAYYGTVGTEDTVSDITALGDAVNVAARLASTAGPGEILTSDVAYNKSGLSLGPTEHRVLALKGRTEPVPVHVLTVTHVTAAAGVTG